jgi:hypothetical protein
MAATVYRFSALVLVLLLQGVLATESRAAEGWVCTETILGKHFETDYVVVGESLIMNKGKGRASILLNDEQFLIAYFSFWINGPHLKWKYTNGDRTEVEPAGTGDVPAIITHYIVINKTQNILIQLNNGSQVINAALAQNVPPSPKGAVYAPRSIDQS